MGYWTFRDIADVVDSVSVEFEVGLARREDEFIAVGLWSEFKVQTSLPEFEERQDWCFSLRNVQDIPESILIAGGIS